MRDVPLRIYLPDQCPVIQGLVPFQQDSGNNAVVQLERETILIKEFFLLVEILLLSQAITRLIPALDEEALTPVLVMTHGIELPLDMPIHWAYENLCFADNFLHLVIKQKESNK